MKNDNVQLTGTALEEKVNGALVLARTMANEGKEKYEIRMALMSQGFSYDDADAILNHVQPGTAATEDNTQSDDIAAGILWLVGGILVTALTYAAASDGGIFIIAYGPVIYGVLRLLKGLFGK